MSWRELKWSNHDYSKWINYISAYDVIGKSNGSPHEWYYTVYYYIRVYTSPPMPNVEIADIDYFSCLFTSDPAYAMCVSIMLLTRSSFQLPFSFFFTISPFQVFTEFFLGGSFMLFVLVSVQQVWKLVGFWYNGRNWEYISSFLSVPRYI